MILSLSGDGGSSSTTESLIRAVLGDLDPEIFDSINYSLRKGGHVVGYGILGFLNFRALGYRRALVAVLLILPVAMTDELRQSLNPLRTGSVADIGFDLCGAALFVVARKAAHHRGAEDAERNRGPRTEDRGPGGRRHTE